MKSVTSLRWEKSALEKIVASSFTVREALSKLGLKTAGGNYTQFSYYVKAYSLDIKHFTGRSWRKDKKIPRNPVYSLSEILVENSSFQSNKLKKRLYSAGIKNPACEECGWCKMSDDGRVPLELDHVNGNNKDNRIENLRILCPNCHSLKPTHRGSNVKLKRAGVMEW